MVERHSSEAQLAGFTEQASNALFFAQYYSSPTGPLPIEPEHILLALLLTDAALFQKLSPSGSDQVKSIGDALKAFDPTSRKPWLAADAPILSPAAEAVVADAATECASLGHREIGTEHLLLALVKNQTLEPSAEQGPSLVSQILQQRGFTADRITARIRGGSITPQEGQSSGSHRLIGSRPFSDKPKAKQ